MNPFTRYFTGRTIGHQVQETQTEGSRTSGLTFYGHSPQGTVKLDMYTDPDGIDRIKITLHDAHDETRVKEIHKGALQWGIE